MLLLALKGAYKGVGRKEKKTNHKIMCQCISSHFME